MANRVAEHAVVRKQKKSSKFTAGNEITVQGTNDSSIGSKFSMASIGYFDDKFLQYFVKKKTRRAPLINRGYYIRAKTIDYAMKAFLSNHCQKDVQIISLGAGFDTSFFRLRDEGLLSNAKFLELDFPDVVRRKISIIQENKTLSDLAGNIRNHKNGIVTDSYMLVSCNITDIQSMEAILDSSHFKHNVPTLFMSEVVLTYIEKESCSRLIEWTKKRFINSVFLLYEQIHPTDGFGLVMLRHFKRLQSPLRCIEYYPNIASQIQRFQALGWPSVNAIDMNNFYHNIISNEERNRVDQLEQFDEFEEWHLKCSHYSIVAAFSGSCLCLKSKLFAGERGIHDSMTDAPSVLPWRCQNEDIVEFERYGHQLVEISKGLVFISGGFGRCGSRHQRLDDGVLIDCRLGNPRNIKVTKIEMFKEPRMYHSTTLLRNGLVFVFGGRASPSKPSKDCLILRCPDEINKSHFETIWTESLLSDQPSACKHLRPSCRWRHSATSVTLENGREHVLIFGGRNDMTLALSDCWLFDVDNVCWKENDISGAEIKARHSHAASKWRNNIIFTGGLNEQSQPLNLVQILNIDDKPMRLETIEFDVPFPARYSHTAHVLRDHLWIVGGVGLTLSSDLIVLQLNSFSWRHFDLQASNPAKPILLCNHASVVVEEAELLIVGGGGNCFSFGTHFNKGLCFVEIPSMLV